MIVRNILIKWSWIPNFNVVVNVKLGKSIFKCGRKLMKLRVRLSSGRKHGLINTVQDNYPPSAHASIAVNLLHTWLWAQKTYVGSNSTLRFAFAIRFRSVTSDWPRIVLNNNNNNNNNNNLFTTYVQSLLRCHISLIINNVQIFTTYCNQLGYIIGCCPSTLVVDDRTNYCLQCF